MYFPSFGVAFELSFAEDVVVVVVVSIVVVSVLLSLSAVLSGTDKLLSGVLLDFTSDMLELLPQAVKQAAVIAKASIADNNLFFTKSASFSIDNSSAIIPHLRENFNRKIS